MIAGQKLAFVAAQRGLSARDQKQLLGYSSVSLFILFIPFAGCFPNLRDNDRLRRSRHPRKSRPQPDVGLNLCGGLTFSFV